jgi:rhodanese-related sulfurtransferase
MHRFRFFPIAWVLSIPGMLFSAAVFAADEYPLRARYPDVPIIATAELAKRFNDVWVIDVRSKFEYETLHIKDAVNIPLSKTGFGEKVSALRDKYKKPFVFYCNGKTCHKSYDAVLLAIRARVDDLYAYDAGVFDWAKANPDRTTLLGRTPIRPDQLIDHDMLKAHMLEPKVFSERAAANAVILDVRDRAQRDSPLFPFKELRAQLDETAKIDAAINEAKSQKKTLLVYDQVGKQVQWLQYRFEDRGLKDYYFMKGGAQAHFDATLGKVVLGGGQEAQPKK